MVGHPKHVAKALAVGADLICAQGGEGGGVRTPRLVKEHLTDPCTIAHRGCRWHHPTSGLHR